MRSGPLMRLITPSLPGLGFKRKGINQRNIASRTHWTQPQTCEPRHFLTPSTERNNYLVSDTVRARLDPPLFETKPAIRPAIQTRCSHCVVSTEAKKSKKGLAACSLKSPEIQSCSSHTDRGITAAAGPPVIGGLHQPGQPFCCCRTRPGRNKLPVEGGPRARVTAPATPKRDHDGLAGASS